MLKLAKEKQHYPASLFIVGPGQSSINAEWPGKSRGLGKADWYLSCAGTETFMSEIWFLGFLLLEMREAQGFLSVA